MPVLRRSPEKELRELKVLCPHDGSEMSVVRRASTVPCGTCGRSYPFDRGILRLCEADDDFYEGAYKNRIAYFPKSEKWHDVWPLWIINSGYPWVVRGLVPAGQTVLDIGCAGGVEYFGRRYRMIGADLSGSSLRLAAESYELLLQADLARNIPVPCGAVDAVVSSFVWEHIPPDAKTDLLRECRRVLRPGGILIFLYDVENRNPLFRWMKKRNEALFLEQFIRKDGHYGYQTAEGNDRLFLAGGFRIVKEEYFERTFLQSPSVYGKLREWGGTAGWIGSIGSSLQKAPLYYAYAGLIRIVDSTVGRLLPKEWGRFAIAVCERT